MPSATNLHDLAGALAIAFAWTSEYTDFFESQTGWTLYSADILLSGLPFDLSRAPREDTNSLGSADKLLTANFIEEKANGDEASAGVAKNTRLMEQDEFTVKDLFPTVGDTATWTYSMDELWTVKLTREPVTVPRQQRYTAHRPMGGANQLAAIMGEIFVLDSGQGDSPPENIGGASGYRTALTALSEPTCIGSEDTTDWFTYRSATVWRPEVYDPGRIQNSLDIGLTLGPFFTLLASNHEEKLHHDAPRKTAAVPLLIAVNGNEHGRVRIGDQQQK